MTDYARSSTEQTVQRVAVEEMPPARPKATVTTLVTAPPVRPDPDHVDAAPPPVKAQRDPEERNTAIIAALEAARYVLAPKAVILMALIGALVLALIAMFRGFPGLYVLLAYCVLTVIPLVVQEIVRAR